MFSIQTTRYKNLLKKNVAIRHPVQKLQILLGILLLSNSSASYRVKILLNTSTNTNVRSSTGSVPSSVGHLRKMQNFWANFTDFEPEINIIKCKTEKPKQKT